MEGERVELSDGQVTMENGAKAKEIITRQDKMLRNVHVLRTCVGNTC